ncbi:MAG: biopolymer transporter ExbB [Nitrospina sp.]|jgi:chemotaxis protein MotA|nr:biopolymer transporter ExbB [Nitrospina sp.]MBT3510251.1 biopolymer transporter ExbB [Nitrospina sp.]MBT3876780.1 biopolymer transporter ExbB [Nitrospina sp.]MBT4048136.1 biopolymer transporter ExbB [Nitrospina sp.]MBT4556822.1 biopolymer transporter ExbB [Nitrospina sp.]
MATATQEAQGTAADAAQEERQDTGIDTGTLMGVLSGVFLITVAIIRGGDAGVFININSALIVVGGSIATAFIAFPAKKITTLMPVLYNAFKPGVYEPEDYVDDIMRLASKYRSGGMKQLENEEGKVDNRFLRNGIAMIVDGYNAKEIHELMDREMNAMLDRHNSGQKVLRFMSVQAPVFGMAGTLIGLVQMLMHIDDPSTIGPALATALITTFYGLMLANLVLTPLAAKLSMRTDMEGILGRSIRVGIIGIHDRVNPAKIQRNMNALLPPDQQRE